MTDQAKKTVSIWLYIVSVIIVGLVVFGGYVRLTRSGLSIVEWNVFTGIVPPMGEEAWTQEFAKYQATPEFQKVNAAMTLAEYKNIFYLEYIHRMIARTAGLVVILPLLWFLFRGTIPWRKSGVYIFIALLFIFQGFMGWYMVSSGLVDRPAVSHFRLTIHLLLALTLLGITLWTAFNLTYGGAGKGAPKSAGYWLSIGLLGALLVQISYGGLVAGLKAGHVSATWPLMFGEWVPPGLLATLQPWWRNLVEMSVTVHFTHRWFAWLVLAMAVILYVVAKQEHYSSTVNKGLVWMMILIGVQITLGVSVIWFHVPLALALTHQFTAMLLFVVNIFLTHRILGETASQTSQELSPARVAA